MIYILFLVYSGMMMDAEPMVSLETCVSASRERIGQELKVTYWDNMNGSHPIPKVVYAFCAPGAVAKEFTK